MVCLSLMLLLLFGTFFMFCCFGIVSQTRVAAMAPTTRTSYPTQDPTMTASAAHLRRSARLPVLSMKVDLMFVRCVCVPNLLYMCEYINFYKGGGTPQLPMDRLFKGL